MKNDAFDFKKFFLFIAPILFIIIVALLAGDATTVILLAIVYGVIAIPVIAIFSQSNKSEEEETGDKEYKDKNIDGAWYSNYYMRKIYKAYNIHEENEPEINNSTPKHGNQQRRENYSRKKETKKLETQSALSSFEIEDLENKVNLYKRISTVFTTILILFGIAYLYLYFFHQNALNEKEIQSPLELLILGMFAIVYAVGLLENRALSRLGKEKINIVQCKLRV